MKPGKLLNGFRSRRHYIILAAAVSINVFTAFSDMPVENIRLYSYLSFFLYGSFIILSFPPRLIPGLYISAAFLSVALFWINEEKSVATRMPLTYLDFEINAADPSSLLNAVGAPGWALYLLIAAAAAIALAIAWVAAVCIQRLRESAKKMSAAGITLNALAVLLLLGSTGIFVNQYTALVKTYTKKNDLAWDNLDFCYLSRTLSIWGFLVYTVYLHRTETEDLYASPTGAVPSRDEITNAAKKYMNIGPAGSHRTPNIVVVLAESTFNPSDIFKLSEPVSNRMFAPDKYTQAIGPLYVNAVGGGTWITEFEFITGIDSRMFGYSGYYTHSSLSPYIHRSFVSYLKEHGYDTAVHYSVDGDFYNAAKAYKYYGIDKFTENTVGAGWTTDDEELIEAVIGQSKPTGEPFFEFIVTIGNHSPHRCTHFTREDQLVTTFDGMDTFNEANCALNEFIRNMHSTERAFLRLIEYLKEQEKLTGRPFVLLIYGDHQPHTFLPHDSGDDGNKFDYGRFRKGRNERETFFHIVSSIPGILNCCAGEPPHITMMPTLLSAYVASGYDDLYLDVNLYSYLRCGSDFIDSGISKGGYGTARPEEDNTRMCPVYDRLMTAYGKSGIFSGLR